MDDIKAGAEYERHLTDAQVLQRFYDYHRDIFFSTSLYSIFMLLTKRIAGAGGSTRVRTCKIKTLDGVLDLASAGKLGLGLPSPMVDNIDAFDMMNINRITFIENKTNYDEYLLSEKASDELVLYHGGFLSPQKRKLYEKLSLAVHDGVEVSF